MVDKIEEKARVVATSGKDMPNKKAVTTNK